MHPLQAFEALRAIDPTVTHVKREEHFPKMEDRYSFGFYVYTPDACEISHKSWDDLVDKVREAGKVTI